MTEQPRGGGTGRWDHDPSGPGPTSWQSPTWEPHPYAWEPYPADAFPDAFAEAVSLSDSKAMWLFRWAIVAVLAVVAVFLWILGDDMAAVLTELNSNERIVVQCDVPPVEPRA